MKTLKHGPVNHYNWTSSRINLPNTKNTFSNQYFGADALSPISYKKGPIMVAHMPQSGGATHIVGTKDELAYLNNICPNCRGVLTKKNTFLYKT